MSEFLNLVSEKKVKIPAEVLDMLSKAKSLTLFTTHEELVAASTMGKENDYFEVKYDTPGKGLAIK